MQQTNSSLSLRIKNALENHLPGEEAHLPMSPSGRGKSSELFKETDFYKISSVAVILVQAEDGLKIILTQRMDYEGAHSGQISFPGGRKEDLDTELWNTAIRETQEEIGVQLHSENLLGKLTNVYIPVSGFLVYPFVFYLEEQPCFTNNYEVKETFFITDEQLLNEHSVSKMSVSVSSKFNMIVPCFNIENRQIWGATAIILNELKVLLQQIKN